MAAVYKTPGVLHRGEFQVPALRGSGRNCDSRLHRLHAGGDEERGSPLTKRPNPNSRRYWSTCSSSARAKTRRRFSSQSTRRRTRMTTRPGEAITVGFADGKKPSVHTLYYAMKSYFSNGGGPLLHRLCRWLWRDRRRQTQGRTDCPCKGGRAHTYRLPGRATSGRGEVLHADQRRAPAVRRPARSFRHCGPAPQWGRHHDIRRTQHRGEEVPGGCDQLQCAVRRGLFSERANCVRVPVRR